MEIKVDSSRLVILPIEELRPDPKNRNIHPEDQILRLMELIKAHGFRVPIIVSQETKTIKAGHGRLEAAKRLGMKEVPVLIQSFSGESEEFTFAVSDNAIASWAELDYAGISLDLGNFGPDDLNVDHLGIKNFTVDVAEKGGEGDGDSIYTKKIDAPIYEPKGENPKEEELFNSTKTDELLREISEADLPAEARAFLTAAAARHTVFDFEKIAEYYAHAPAHIQELMQRSALVIIDFKKAIEFGFVKMTKEIAEVYPNDAE